MEDGTQKNQAVKPGFLYGGKRQRSIVEGTNAKTHTHTTNGQTGNDTQNAAVTLLRELPRGHRVVARVDGANGADGDDGRL